MQPNEVKNRIAMAPNMKSFALLACAINDDVSSHAPDKYLYVLSSSIYRGRPGQLFKKNSIVSSLPDEFWSEEARFGWLIETVVTVRPNLNKYIEIAA